MIIAEIIRVEQPDMYNLLEKIYSLDMLPLREVDFEVSEEDEDWEYREMKYLMEERKGVVL